MNRNTNSEHFAINNRHSIHNKNKSLIQDAKSIETHPLKISQKNSDFTYNVDDVKNKCKAAIIQFHKNHLKIHHFSQQIFYQLQEIDKAANINKLFEHLFNILKSICSRQRIQQYKNRIQEQPKGLIIKIKSTEATKLKLIKQQPVQKTKINKKIEDLENNLIQTKKELFNLREQKLYLQKKVISIIQEYQIRKKNYLAEIKKLTNIVHLSSIDIQNLVLEKTFDKRLIHKTEDNRIPLFQSTNNKEQPIRIEDKDIKRWNPGEQNGIEKRRYSPPNKWQYNVQVKMLKSLDSVQQMEETRY